MTIKRTVFGRLATGEPVYRYLLQNRRGSQVAVLSYGATWQSFIPNGKIGRDIVVHYDDLAAYLNNPLHLGNTIGPVGGRLSANTYQLEPGQSFRLSPNEGDHVLHSGQNGFDLVNWSAMVEEGPGFDQVRFTHHFNNEFPGVLTVTVTYQLDDQGQVTISFTGRTTATTLFNPMTHVYFNLSGQNRTIQPAELRLAADQRVVVDGAKLPTGKLMKTAGSAYDFSHFRSLGMALAELPQHQLDDAWLLKPRIRNEPVVALQDPRTKQRLTIQSDRNGVVVFTVNPAALQHDAAWEASQPPTAVAIELQTLPDAINHQDFGDILLLKGQEKTYTVHYQVDEVNINESI